ncbi:MAG: hypothetical protein HY586_02755 [Candidatus Omnitrophica bacterium]|nr:hypothetical protein [Candidatus Omnitrophota bacterium]
MTESLPPQILQKLEEELTRERIVTSNQLLGISRHYSAADFGEFKALVEEKARLGDHLDLFMILSYNFTPDVNDRAYFSSFLDSWTPMPGDIQKLIDALAAKRLEVDLGVAESNLKIHVPLFEDVIGRYVRNLRLDSPLAGTLKKVIGELIVEEEADRVKAIFRDEVWQAGPWKELAVPILYALSHKRFRIEKLIYLTTFLAANRPKNMAGLVRLMAEVIESHETEIRRLDKGAKMFFNEMLRESYDGTGADRREKEDEKLNLEKRQYAIAGALLEDLRSI